MLVDISGNTATLTTAESRRRRLSVVDRPDGRGRHHRAATRRARHRAPERRHVVAAGDDHRERARRRRPERRVRRRGDGGEPGRAARPERRAPRARDSERRPPHRGQRRSTRPSSSRSRCRAGRSKVTWTVESVTLVDQVGNQQTLTAPGVTFTQTGIGDTSPPQFRSFSLSTTNVDVRTSSASIVMRSRIVDDLSGAADGLVDSATSVVFESPSGRQRLTVPFGAAQRVGGNGLDGNYSIQRDRARPRRTRRVDDDRRVADRPGRQRRAPLGRRLGGEGVPGSFTVVSDTPPDTGPTVPPDPTTTSTTSGSVFTTTTDAGVSTTTVPGNSTTSAPIRRARRARRSTPRARRHDDPSRHERSRHETTVPGDGNSTSTSTTVPESTTSVPDATSTTTTTTHRRRPRTTVTTHDARRRPRSRPRRRPRSRPRRRPRFPCTPTRGGTPHLRRANGYWFATTTGRVRRLRRGRARVASRARPSRARRRSTASSGSRARRRARATGSRPRSATCGRSATRARTGRCAADR